MTLFSYSKVKPSRLYSNSSDLKFSPSVVISLFFAIPLSLSRSFVFSRFHVIITFAHSIFLHRSLPCQFFCGCGQSLLFPRERFYFVLSPLFLSTPVVLYPKWQCFMLNPTLSHLHWTSPSLLTLFCVPLHCLLLPRRIFPRLSSKSTPCFFLCLAYLALQINSLFIPNTIKKERA